MAVNTVPVIVVDITQKQQRTKGIVLFGIEI